MVASRARTSKGSTRPGSISVDHVLIDGQPVVELAAQSLESVKVRRGLLRSVLLTAMFII
jgi:hypothetical protein